MRGELATRLAVSVAVVIGVLALSAAVRRETALAVAGEAVAIVGIFSLPVAYRLYRKGEEVRTATLRAATVTAVAALAGAVVIAGGGAWSAVSGALAHLLLVGVIWPTPERLRNFGSEEER